MRVLKLVFPIGAVMTVGGVFLYAQLERHSFENTQDLEFAVLSQIFMPVLLLGSGLAIVGSFLDRQHLTAKKSRARGLVCWLVSAVSFVHGWTFSFIFPAFVGFISGAVFLSKLSDREHTGKPISPPGS
jgi:peptidoglycan/LPS O-acetylase OafA/YrhL